MANEVYFNQNPVIRVGVGEIEALKEQAKKSKNGKFRLCMQHSPGDPLHEMFIVRSRGDYGRPDKHLYTTESHTIVDGAMLVILFEEDGEIKEVFELSKDNVHTYRIDTDIYHMQIPLTEQVVYYEVKLGPFTAESNVFPDWAPDPLETEQAAIFMKTLKERIKTFQSISE